MNSFLFFYYSSWNKATLKFIHLFFLQLAATIVALKFYFQSHQVAFFSLEFELKILLMNIPARHARFTGRNKECMAWCWGETWYAICISRSLFSSCLLKKETYFYWLKSKKNPPSSGIELSILWVEWPLNWAERVGQRKCIYSLYFPLFKGQRSSEYRVISEKKTIKSGDSKNVNEYGFYIKCYTKNMLLF